MSFSLSDRRYFARLSSSCQRWGGEGGTDRSPVPQLHWPTPSDNGLSNNMQISPITMATPICLSPTLLPPLLYLFYLLADLSVPAIVQHSSTLSPLLSSGYCLSVRCPRPAIVPFSFHPFSLNLTNSTENVECFESSVILKSVSVYFERSKLLNG